MNLCDRSGKEEKLRNNCSPSVNSNTAFNGDSFASSSNSSVSKNKNSWFSSLTRRKKSSEQILQLNFQDHHQIQNNNNEPLRLLETNSNTDEGSNLEGDAVSLNYHSKRRDDTNLFQRLGRKMGLRLSSFRNKRNTDSSNKSFSNGGTLDASAEFLSESPIREKESNIHIISKAKFDTVEDKLFSHDFDRFIVKKWLDQECVPNHVMYKASSEMLSQVWYWGEISRLDAQKQLSDKPTGSFLVRDSETRGCQFTLSFRIVNVTLHYRLEYRDNYWHFEELQYESIVEMIEDICCRCTNDNFVCFVKVQNELQPPCPVILKYPLSRYFQMPYLQDLCRRVIQRHAAPEEIMNLPVPPKLQKYLSVKRELVFQS